MVFIETFVKMIYHQGRQINIHDNRYIVIYIQIRTTVETTYIQLCTRQLIIATINILELLQYLVLKTLS